jgi:hypothetical protein
MNFKAEELREALAKSADACPPQDVDSPPPCDVVFLLFLEPPVASDARLSTFECLLDKAIRVFQPHPPLAHCELLIPPVPFHEGLRTNFATYLGRQSAWQIDREDGLCYYLEENSGRWRAVPVFRPNAGEKVRTEADGELGVDYSLSRYLSAVPPGRWFSGFVPDRRRSPAHCATLAARVLRNSGVYEPLHAPAFYGPSTLHNEITAATRYTSEKMGAAKWDGMPLDVAQDVDVLLRGVMSAETVRRVGDTGCVRVVEALTRKACNALVGGDSTSQRLSQQQLATALLRWVTLRDLNAPSAPDEMEE